VPTVARMVLSVIAPLSLCGVLEVGTLASAQPGSAEVVSNAPATCINDTTTPTELPGASGVTIADTCQSSSDNLTGGEQIPAASFAKPTRSGDLLVAAVLCGVLNAGMKVPKLSPPSGWTKAKKHTGGIQGGLEAAIYYRANNQGGITSVMFGQIPAGNDYVDCTTFTWEITGAGDSASLDATGFASVEGGMSITAATSKATTYSDDLVLVAETDGSQYPPNSYEVSRNFDLVSVWANGQTYQPGTFSALVTAKTGVQQATVTQASSWLDSTAVIVTLSV